MRQIFQQSRISFNNLLTDAKKFLSDKYNQNGKTYTPASPFGQILTVVVGLAQQIFYYIEDSVTEMNITSASRESSVKGLVALTGYQPKTATPAMGNVNIRYNGTGVTDSSVSQIILPNYTRVFCNVNNLYYLIESNSEIRFSTATGNRTTSAKLIQGELYEETFTGNGKEIQSFRINERYSDYVDMETLKVTVNGIECTRYESLWDIPLGKYGFIARTSIGGGFDVFMGTVYNGIIPQPGSLIRIQYIKSVGSAGNLIDARNISFEFIDEGYDNFGNTIDLNEHLSLSAVNGLIFGSNPEDVELSKLVGPKHSRAFVLSNTDAYEAYLNRMNYFSTVDVYDTFNDSNYNDDNVIYMFLIPNLRLRISPKFNYFTSPLNSFLMTSQEKSELLQTIEKSGQVMIGTEFEILQPTIKRFTVHVIVDWFKGYSKELIRDTIITSLSTYFINYTRRDRIPKSDLIAIIEGIDGVDSVNVYFKEDPNNFNNNEDSYINDMGDIIIGSRDYPMIRGGWVDEDGISYLEGLSENNPSSLNITFQEEVDKNVNRTKNKVVVSDIRNRRM